MRTGKTSEGNATFKSDENLRRLIFLVAMKCKTLFDEDGDEKLCKYRGMRIKCCDVFKPLFSDHGFCFSFNPRYIERQTESKT